MFGLGLKFVVLSFRYIDDNAFRDLKILVDLDLTKNNITKLRPKTFEGNDGLQSIKLAYNTIGILQVILRDLCRNFKNNVH